MNTITYTITLEDLEKFFRRGIITEEEYRTRYCELTGEEIAPSPRSKHTQLPFTFEGYDEAGYPGDFKYYRVQWTEDWGPFKAGDEWETVIVLLSESVIQVWEGETLSISAAFGFCPKS